MDREVIAGLPRKSSCVALLEALQHLAPRIGAQLVAEGVERPEQVATLRQYGVGIAQGNLFALPNRRPLTYLPISGMREFRAPVSPTRGLPGARITDFMHPAVTLPISATGEEVRTVLRDRPAISGLLLDDDGRPRYMLDRNRFLLEASGASGHADALVAKREAAQLATNPECSNPAPTRWPHWSLCAAAWRTAGTTTSSWWTPAGGALVRSASAM